MEVETVLYWNSSRLIFCSLVIVSILATLVLNMMVKMVIKMVFKILIKMIIKLSKMIMIISK